MRNQEQTLTLKYEYTFSNLCNSTAQVRMNTGNLIVNAIPVK